MKFKFSVVGGGVIVKHRRIDDDIVSSRVSHQDVAVYMRRYYVAHNIRIIIIIVIGIYALVASHTGTAILQCLFLFLLSFSISRPSGSLPLCFSLQRYCASSFLFQKRKRISRARLIRFDVPARVAKAISSSGPSPPPFPFKRARTLYDREIPNSIKPRRSDLISRERAGERNVRRLNTSYRQNCLQTICTGPSPPRRIPRHRNRPQGTVITFKYVGVRVCVCKVY